MEFCGDIHKRLCHNLQGAGGCDGDFEQHPVVVSTAKSAQGCNMEHGLVKIDGCNCSNVQCDAKMLAAVDDANIECRTTMDMAYHNRPSRRPHMASRTGSLKCETYLQLGVSQHS